MHGFTPCYRNPISLTIPKLQFPYSFYLVCFISISVAFVILVSGCARNPNTPDLSVQMLLGAIGNHDSKLFYQYVDPVVQERTYSELVRSYLGDELSQISINMNIDAIDILFRDLIYTVKYQDKKSAIVNVGGYIKNIKTGVEITLNKDISTRSIEGKWLVIFPENTNNTQSLIFIPHEIQQAPTPQENFVKWTIYGSIKNIGSKYYLGFWPVAGRAKTTAGSFVDAKIEFFCQPDYVIQDPSIEALAIPPGLQIKGVPGCNIAIVVETEINSLPLTLLMDNFRDSDLTKTQPEARLFSMASNISFPQTADISPYLRIVYDGISTNFIEVNGNYGINLVVYIQLINLAANQAQNIEGLSAFLIGQDGYILTMRVIYCDDPSISMLSISPGGSISRRICIPLENHDLQVLNLTDGFTLVFYFANQEFVSTYQFNFSPYLLFADAPLTNFQNFFNGNILFPGIVSQSQVSWNIGLALMLYGACNRIERLDDQTLSLYLKDGRIIFVLIPANIDINRIIIICGNSCPQITWSTNLPAPTSIPHIIPTPSTSGSIPTGWIIVIGAFKDYDYADKWTVRFHNAGYPTAIYYRNSYYRVVIPGYASESQAQSALPRVQMINPDAYLRELSDWCPFAVFSPGLLTCK